MTDAQAVNDPRGIRGDSTRAIALMSFGLWMLGLVPGTLYILFNPDGIAHNYMNGTKSATLKSSFLSPLSER